MDSVKERFKKIASSVGEKSVKSMAVTLGIPYNTIGTWGKKDEITPEGIMIISEKYQNISKEYLKKGTGDMLKLDTGVSNYGHDARANEVAQAYASMSNEDQKIFYSLAVKFRKEDKLKAFDDAFKE